MTNSGSLYGITHTNREAADLWGKNQFNSTFPVALACYMRDHNLPAIYLNLIEELRIECSELPINDLFNSELSNEKLYFEFESCFEPYANFVDHGLERVDLIIREAREVESAEGGKQVLPGKHLRALEVKLTVVPDNSTASSSPDAWFPELVIRPATTMYCALSMASRLPQAEVKEIFHPVGKDVLHWNDLAAAISLLPKALDALNVFQKKFCVLQQPLIMQPIWRTKGKKPVLDDNAFDIFVWSDYALMRVFIDMAMKDLKAGKISRYGRSALRLTRFLYEFGRAGQAHLENIFADMTYGHQTDKEFAFNGAITKKYMQHPRMEAPIVGHEVVKKLILHGGEEFLSPERRLDQTIYFTYQLEK